jgi:exonuclease VII small subunit
VFIDVIGSNYRFDQHINYFSNSISDSISYFTNSVKQPKNTRAVFDSTPAISVMNIHQAQEILNISSLDISISELKSAYRLKAQETHPDKGGSSAEFIAVRTAFTTIRDYLLSDSKTSTDYTQSDRSQSTPESESHSTNDTDQSIFWQSKYQEAFQQLHQSTLQNQSLWDSVKQYEDQINQIINIFNTGQNLLRDAQTQVNERLQRLDDLYEKEQQNLKKKFQKGWLDLLLDRKKMSQQDYVQLHNHLIRSINQEEQKIINEYHQKTTAIYREIMSTIHTVLSTA